MPKKTVISIMLLCGLMNVAFSKIELLHHHCQYDDQLGFEMCKKQDKSDLVSLTSQASHNSYKLDQDIEFTSDSKGSWLYYNIIKPKLEKLKQHYKHVVSFGHNSAGIIFVDSGKIIISFHGTQNAEDIKTDATFMQGDLNILGMHEGAYAHSGFLQRYLSDRADMLEKLTKIIKQKHHVKALTKLKTLFTKNKTKQPLEIIITGHSMGGALATLAAFDIKHNVFPESQVTLVTFNSPRVFNSTAAQTFEQLLPDQAYRFWREYDPVSAVPLGRQGYKHVGKSLKLPAVNYFYPADNHRLTHTIKEVDSPYTIRPEAEHRGWL